MSLLANTVKRGPTVEPLRILLHGQEGVGKTTFLAGCPGVLTLTIEDGGGDLDYARAVLGSWADLRQAVRELIADPRAIAAQLGMDEIRAIGIDTIDAFERLLWAFICEEADAKRIEDVGGGYGKGYTAALEEMAALSRDLDTLRAKQRIHVILLAHSHVKAFNDPMGAPYDRYEVRLHKGTADLWKGWADAILFACFDVTVMKSGKRGRAVEAGALEKGKALEGAKRVIYTSKEAAYDAKNRHNLPDEIPLNWRAFAQAIRWDERDAAIRAPLKPKHHPSFEADRPGFMAFLSGLGDPYVPVGGKNLYNTICDFLAAGGLPRPSSVSQEGRNKYRMLLDSEACRKAFIPWEIEGVVPDFKALGKSATEAAAAK
jgi:hypothetical protein